jgi:hypothetical protein
MSLTPKNEVSGNIYSRNYKTHTTFNLNYLSDVIVVMDGTVIHHNYAPFHGKWIQVGGLVRISGWIT